MMKLLSPASAIIFALALALALALAIASASAEQTHHPYAGFEDRQITSLSDEDIEQLSKGAGWGLALPAELNSHPGPAHLLELQTELELRADQVAAWDASVAEMRKAAIANGQRLIAAERALDQAFDNGGLSPEDLRTLIDEAEAARADLRFVHLSRHLETVELLTSDQIVRYGQLRGYADDPCASVPEGHNATMWRLHNGCSD